MILLRHGQSEFNLHFTATRVDPGIPDPKLTPLGHTQAQAAAEALMGEPIKRIVVSPYTRALETAAPLAKRLGLTPMVTPLVAERYAFACDIGSPTTELAMAWPHLDFTHIDEIWWPGEEEPSERIDGRALRFAAEMQLLPDWEHTVVVSHWGFILAMTGERINNGEWRRWSPGQPPGYAAFMASR